MSDINCDEVRQLAPEAALDLLDGPDRSEVFVHVAGCAPCRAELADLAGVADALLLVAHPAEPPPGFETRVLTRLLMSADDRPVDLDARRRRWRSGLAAAAAALLVIALLGGVARLRDGAGSTRGIVAAHLLGTDGRTVGEVLVSENPDRMVCVLDNAPAGAVYSVSVVAEDAVADVGTFTAAGPGWPWSVDLPVDGSDVRRVTIRDAKGRVRAWAELPA